MSDDTPVTETPDNPLRLELTGDAPIVEWLYPDILAQGTLISFAGTPGTGKSFISYTLGFSLACGLPFGGSHPERTRRVLYFDEENSKPDRIQYERWAWHGLNRPNLDQLCDNFWVESCVLGDSEWPKTVAKGIALYQPELIIFDTATPAFAINDENDNSEAAKVVATLRHLQRQMETPPTMLVLKHAKIYEDGTPTLRGAKAWEGAVDGIMFAHKGQGRPKQGLSRVTIAPGKTRAFGLRHTLITDPTWTTLDREGLDLNITRRGEKAEG